jgi:hypothetical protein
MTTYDISAVYENTWDGLEISLVVNTLPLDLTGATVSWVVLDTAGSLMVEAEIGSGLTILDGPEGELRIDPFLMTWQPGVYTHQLTITKAGRVKTYLKGKVRVE